MPHTSTSGKSLRAIGKELGVSKDTVSAVLDPKTDKRTDRVRLHPDPARAAATILKARD